MPIDTKMNAFVSPDALRCQAAMNCPSAPGKTS
jgi:hypothetical protein